VTSPEAVEEVLPGDPDPVEGDPAVVHPVQPHLEAAVLDADPRRGRSPSVVPEGDQEGVDPVLLVGAPPWSWAKTVAMRPCRAAFPIQSFRAPGWGVWISKASLGEEAGHGLQVADVRAVVDSVMA
jgi:hypothetical protein